MKQHFDDECVVSVDLTALAKHQQQVMADVISGRIDAQIRPINLMTRRQMWSCRPGGAA